MRERTKGGKKKMRRKEGVAVLFHWFLEGKEVEAFYLCLIGVW